MIGRGLFDMKYSLTDNTDLVNTLLVESVRTTPSARTTSVSR